MKELKHLYCYGRHLNNFQDSVGVS